MINGLGVLGWGVGGIEAEAVMLGECTAMVLPEVVGFKLTGALPKTATATDLVLTCTEMLRKRGVVGKFVEFYGPGLKCLTLADRATVANMAPGKNSKKNFLTNSFSIFPPPEYGATTGFFPCDQATIDYLRQTGRDENTVQVIETYLRANGLFRTYEGGEQDPVFSGESLTLDLSTVVPSLAGPKRPQDRVALSNLKKEFNENLCKPVSFKNFGVKPEEATKTAEFEVEG